MSNPLFNEVGIDGKSTTPYKFGDWRRYAIHNEETISGFFGDYRWMSNFESCPVFFDGVLYPSSENAYQAAKVIPEHREIFVTCTAAESKKVWQFPELTRIYTPEQWDESKYEIMLSIVFDKFYRNKDLRNKLIATNKRSLVELNHWGDTFWGIDLKKGGRNNLGQILMIVRTIWTLKPNEFNG